MSERMTYRDLALAEDSEDWPTFHQMFHLLVSARLTRGEWEELVALAEMGNSEVPEAAAQMGTSFAKALAEAIGFAAPEASCSSVPDQAP